MRKYQSALGGIKGAIVSLGVAALTKRMIGQAASFAQTQVRLKALSTEYGEFGKIQQLVKDNAKTFNLSQAEVASQFSDTLIDDLVECGIMTEDKRAEALREQQERGPADQQRARAAGAGQHDHAHRIIVAGGAVKGLTDTKEIIQDKNQAMLDKIGESSID